MSLSSSKSRASQASDSEESAHFDDGSSAASESKLVDTSDPSVDVREAAIAQDPLYCEAQSTMRKAQDNEEDEISVENDADIADHSKADHVNGGHNGTMQRQSSSASSTTTTSSHLQERLLSSKSPETDPLQHLRTLIDIPSTPTNTSWTSMLLEKYQLFRYQCGTFVNHPKIQLLVVVMIAVNALMMGIGTFDFVEDDPQLNEAFEKTDHAFLIMFTIELGLQFVFYGWRLLKNGWLVFDLLVIVVSWSFDSMQIIRAFRVLRALRLITRIKVMQNLVVALFGVVPRMFAIGLLLMLISYIFAVMFTEMFQEAYADGITEIDYFGNLFASFFTLFQYMTMDDWATSVRELSDDFPWAWLPAVIFIIITAFVVVNLIIAVICDAISALHDDDKAKLHGTFESEEDQDTQDGSVGRYSLRKDLHTQLDALEENVDELMRMQEETVLALRGLTQYVAEKQRRKALRRRRSSASTRNSRESTSAAASMRRRRWSDAHSLSAATTKRPETVQETVAETSSKED